MRDLPTSVVVFLWLVVSAFGAVAHAQKPAGDPVVGVWRMDDGRNLEFAADGSATIRLPGKYVLKGKWDSDPFSEKFRRYVIRWEIDQVYDLQLAPDGSAIRGAKKEGTTFTASRLDRLTIYVWADDNAQVCLNGIPVIKTEIPRLASAFCHAKSGDILTVELTNRRGEAAFALEGFKGDKRIFDASGFQYTRSTAPDWMTNPDRTAYRAPVMKVLKDQPIANVREPQKALPQAGDEKGKKFFFKYVIR